MITSEVELNDLLNQFEGKSIDTTTGPRSKTFALNYFTQNLVPYFHTDIPFNACGIYQNYKENYQHSGATFNGFLYYHLIQTMQKPEFEFLRYRYINDKWYSFENLPFFISVVLQKSDQQLSIFIENVGKLTWQQFIATYDNQVSHVRKTETGTKITSDAWFVLAHQITSMPFFFSSYIPSFKRPEHDAHSPWFVFSKRQIEDGKTQFQLSCTVSHASCSPAQLHSFLKEFRKSITSV